MTCDGHIQGNIIFDLNKKSVKSLPLKVLDFRLQRLTEPNSGVAASILLVSPGLNLAEVCATCLRCHLW